MLRFVVPLTGVGLLACGLLGVAQSWSQVAPAVRIENFTFSPGRLTVAKGTEVTWTNRDDIPHSIVLTAIGVRSKALDTDSMFAYRFDKAGTYSYICGLHPQMHGQVVVR